MTKVIEGGCLCGAIRYRSTMSPVRCLICHCDYCRKHSGAPCLGFVHFPIKGFSWMSIQAGHPGTQNADSVQSAGALFPCMRKCSMIAYRSLSGVSTIPESFTRKIMSGREVNSLGSIFEMICRDLPKAVQPLRAKPRRIGQKKGTEGLNVNPSVPFFSPETGTAGIPTGRRSSRGQPLRSG